VSTLPIIQSTYGLTGTGQQIGGVSAAQLAEVQRRLAQQEANRAAAAGNGAGVVGNGAGPGPFDPRGAFQIPNNFWGFAILMMGLR